MKIQLENKFYDVYHENKVYTNLQFRRLDWIDGVCYITFQQSISSEWFTFEQNKIYLSSGKEINLVS
ncbi:MAG: hypothetical protein ABF649_22090 [Bacillus sp. (in: firmicutes)]